MPPSMQDREAERAARSGRSEASSLRTAVEDLAAGLLPLSTHRLVDEIDACVRRLPSSLNAYGYDPYGLSLAWTRSLALFSALLYRNYFRVETHGIERVPEGPVLIIANHAGQLPFDAMLLSTALLLDQFVACFTHRLGKI